MADTRGAGPFNRGQRSEAGETSPLPTAGWGLSGFLACLGGGNTAIPAPAGRYEDARRRPDGNSHHNPG